MQSKCLITSLILPRHPLKSLPSLHPIRNAMSLTTKNICSYMVWKIFFKRFRISYPLGVDLPPPPLPTLSFPILEIGSEKQRDPASSMIP